MARYGFKLIIGDFLARSVRGVPCSPPAQRKNKVTSTADFFVDKGQFHD
ncbi:hypothetical protein [Pseudomonas phoenicis]